jgi:ABC-type glycerol-3-phosphate transport system substrate-binding protein
MMHTRSRRLLAAAAVLASISGTLLPARAAVSHAGVTITVWHEYSKGNLAAFNHLIAAFEAANPSITVQQAASVNYNALFQKLQSAIFAGNPPTLAQAYEDQVEQFDTKNHAVVDLTPVIKGPQGLSTADIQDFYTSMWADGMLDGKRLMMPFSKSDIVLYYNPALLAKYGITAPPATWSQFAADCAKVTQISNGRAGQWCMTYQVDESTWYAWEHEWGNPVLNAKHQPTFATAQGAAPLAFFANLVKKQEMVVSTTANYQDQADFDAGKTAFDISSSAGLVYEVEGAKPGVVVKVAPLPAGPSGQHTELYGAPFAMFNKATPAQQQAAWLFLKFITEPAQTAYWSIHTGYMPVRRSAVKLPVLAGYYKQYPDRLAAVNQLDNAVLEPPLNGWEKAISDIDTQMAAALTGTTSALAAMRQAAGEVSSDLANAQ